VSLIVSNDWETVLRRVKDDKAYQKQHMSVNTDASKKRALAKRKRMDSIETPKLDEDDEKNHATPQPTACFVDDSIDLTPRPPKSTHREYDVSLDSMSILQNPQHTQGTRAAGQHALVDMSYKQQGLDNDMILDPNDQVCIHQIVIYLT